MKWNELATPGRLDKMRSAMELLKEWQESIYRLPILENTAAFVSEKEQIAAMMVDNHLGKVARRIRMLDIDGRLNSSDFLDRWSELNFLSHLWSRFDVLSDGLKLNLIYQSGPNITSKHLSQENSLTDHFVVTGQEWSMEERLLKRSVYLYGVEHKRFFVLIDYSFNQQPFDRYYQEGTYLEGAVVPYPFPGSLRAGNVRWDRVSPSSPSGPHRLPESNLRQVVDSYGEWLKVNPLCMVYPAVVNLHSERRKDGWKITDMENQVVRMVSGKNDGMFYFYSACFRNPVPVMGLFSRAGFQPLSYYNGEKFIALEEMSLAKDKEEGATVDW